MKQDIFTIDQAVDVVVGDDGMVRFIMPHGDFTMKDPVGMVRLVTDRCREGTTSAALLEHFPADAVEALLNVLTSRRVLIVASGDALKNPNVDPIRDWIRHFAGATDRGLAGLIVAGQGCLANKLTVGLTRTGFTVASPDADNDSRAAVIAACDAPDLAWLRELNMQAMAEQRPFLPVWMDRACVHMGPMALPGATGCLECWWHRGQAALRRDDPGVFSPNGRLPSETVAELAASLVTAELLRWALAANVVTDLGMAWRFDLLTMDFTGAKVLRLPRCPACGNVAQDYAAQGYAA